MKAKRITLSAELVERIEIYLNTNWAGQRRTAGKFIENIGRQTVHAYVRATKQGPYRQRRR